MMTRLAAILLRVAVLAGCWVALGALIYRAPTEAENGVNIGGGAARLAGLVLAIVIGAAVDARRLGFARSVRTWMPVLGVLTVVALSTVVIRSLTGPPTTEPLGLLLPAAATALVFVFVPAGALAVAAAAVADRSRRLRQDPGQVG